MSEAYRNIAKEAEEICKDPSGKRILHKTMILNRKCESYEEFCRCLDLAKTKINTAKLRREANRLRPRKVKEVGKCEICEYDFVPILHMHHILPFKLGGTNESENLVVVCPNCHKVLHCVYSQFLSNDTESFDKSIVEIWEMYGAKKYSNFANIMDRFFAYFQDEENE